MSEPKVCNCTDEDAMECLRTRLGYFTTSYCECACHVTYGKKSYSKYKDGSGSV